MLKRFLFRPGQSIKRTCDSPPNLVLVAASAVEKILTEIRMTQRKIQTKLDRDKLRAGAAK